MLPGLSCSSSIWTGGWEETEPWRDTQSLSTPSRESSSCAETLGTSTSAGTSGRLRNKTGQNRSLEPREVDRHPLVGAGVSPVQLDVHGLLGEAAQFVLFLSETATQRCFTWTGGREIRWSFLGRPEAGVELLLRRKGRRPPSLSSSSACPTPCSIILWQSSNGLTLAASTASTSASRAASRSVRSCVAVA